MLNLYDALKAPTTNEEAALWLRGLFHEALRKRAEELNFVPEPGEEVRSEFRRDVFHVTEIMHDCPRPGVYRLLGYEQDYPDEDAAHWTHVGEMAEQWVRAVLRTKFPGRCRFNQAVVPADHPLHDRLQGHFDAVIDLESFQVVFDCKSRSRAIRQQSDCPAAKDVRQVQTYWQFLQGRTDKPVYATLGHLYRESLRELDVFPVPTGPEIEARTAAQVGALAQYVELKMIPPAPAHFTPDSKPCSWGTEAKECCPWYSRCWGGHEATKPAPVPEPQLQEWMRGLWQRRTARLELEAQVKRLKEEEGQFYQALLPVVQERGGLLASPGDVEKDMKRVHYSVDRIDVNEAIRQEPALRARLAPYNKPYTVDYPSWVKKR